MKLRSQHLTSWLKISGLFVLLAALSPLFGPDEAPPYESYDAFVESGGFALFTVNNLWLLISAALVFIMHLGFSCVETGLCQSKNTVNILFKNLFIVAIGYSWLRVLRIQRHVSGRL
ncbi:MAG: ammonium transporter [Candidatus Synoicihabitans palmerolidicus]|nr:ammonium transporter [Candidatus Synoicihabitans palmerolidicus]